LRIVNYHTIAKKQRHILEIEQYLINKNHKYLRNLRKISLTLNVNKITKYMKFENQYQINPSYCKHSANLI